MRIACLAAAAALALGAGACSRGEAPGSVAERFWRAVEARDRETVLALSIEAEGMSMNLDDKDAVMEDLRIGETVTEGDQAFVGTELTAVREDRSLDLSFETVLAKRDGRWLVDLEETGNRMMKSVLGVSMQELGKAVAEGMQDAMEGMGDATTGAAAGSDDHR